MSDGWKLNPRKMLSDEELALFFVAVRKCGARVHLMMLLTFHGALKVSELIHLRVNDVHSEDKKLSVIPSKKSRIWRSKRNDGQLIVEDVELPPAVAIPIPQIVIDIAFDYVLAEKLAPKGYLFPGRTKTCPVIGRKCKGGHISKRDVQYIFSQIVTDISVQRKGLGIQSLRHARLTKVAKRTKDAHLVREIGRHASVGMSRHYVEFVNKPE